jgi:hypothetical protein
MEVFTCELLDKLKQRYEKSGVLAPPLYRLVTVAKFEPVRKTIQTWVDNLSENSQKKIIAKLTNPKSFPHTYNELKIASFLLEKYSTVEYEEELLGLTPDWTVKNQSGEILFIVEVLTRENSDKNKSLSKRVGELWDKITEIKIGVCLELSFGDDFDERLLDSKLIKQTSFEVKKWLKENPSIGTNKTTGNFEFKVIHYSDKWSNVQIFGPENSFWVDNISLKDNIEEKIKKYKNLIDKFKVPFVIGVVPEFTTGVNKDTLEDILFGQEVVVIRKNGTTFLSRKQDGIFFQRQNISAVIGYFDGDMEIFHNPKASMSFNALI